MKERLISRSWAIERFFQRLEPAGLCNYKLITYHHPTKQYYSLVIKRLYHILKEAHVQNNRQSFAA